MLEDHAVEERTDYLLEATMERWTGTIGWVDNDNTGNPAADTNAQIGNEKVVHDNCFQ